MSGIKTFAAMVDEVELAFGQRTDIATVAGGWVNDAYFRITCSNEIFGQRINTYFPTLEIQSAATNTADGTAYVTTPADCLFIRGIWDSTSDRKLTKLSLADYIQRTGRADSDQEGAPTHWIRRADTTKGNDKTYLFPTPDATYALVIYYRAKPAILTGSGTTVIGYEWDEAIVSLACAIGARRLQMYDTAKVFEEDFKNIVTGLVGIYDNEDLDKEDYRAVDTSYNDFKY